MTQSTKTKRPVKRQVNRLLAFLDGLQEALRVKLEMLHAFPQLIERERRESGNGIGQLIEMNAQTALHVAVLTRMLARFGAACDYNPLSTVSGDDRLHPLKRQLMRETLCRQIFEECREHLRLSWKDSSMLKATIAEQIETLTVECLANIRHFRFVLESPERVGKRLVHLHQTVAAL